MRNVSETRDCKGNCWRFMECKKFPPTHWNKTLEERKAVYAKLALTCKKYTLRKKLGD